MTGALTLLVSGLLMVVIRGNSSRESHPVITGHCRAVEGYWNKRICICERLIYTNDMCCISIIPAQSGKITLFHPSQSVWQTLKTGSLTCLNSTEALQTSQLHKKLLTLDRGGGVNFPLCCLPCCLYNNIQLWKKGGVWLYLQRRPHMPASNNLRSASAWQKYVRGWTI